MDGREVFKFASVLMPQSVATALKANGLSPADLKLLVPHQANLRIMEMVQKTIGLRDDQIYINIQKYGNTTAASDRKSTRLNSSHLVISYAVFCLKKKKKKKKDCKRTEKMTKRKKHAGTRPDRPEP